jgi:hypothetical protein
LKRYGSSRTLLLRAGFPELEGGLILIPVSGLIDCWHLINDSRWHV